MLRPVTDAELVKLIAANRQYVLNSEAKSEQLLADAAQMVAEAADVRVMADEARERGDAYLDEFSRRRAPGRQ